tara:strand:- start:2831 stop:3760 length:930 start_codon:yes stop_codon:yes gene_type:complete
MAFLDNSGDIILDAVLTDTGRFRLAKGDGTFRIVKFALGDDEIDYGTYSRNATSELKGMTVLRTPVMEAFANNAGSMKYKLLSLTENTHLYLPIIKSYANGNSAKFGSGTAAKYVVAVDKSTVDEIVGTTQLLTTGVLNGYQPGQSDHLIIMDQGLDTGNISQAEPLDSQLRETQYSINMDNRLGAPVQPTGTGSPSSATVSFIDDDSIATYILSIGTDKNYIAELPTTIDSSLGLTSISGPVGTRLSFRIQASTSLRTNNYLFTVLGNTGATSIGNMSSYRYIDSTISVTGQTTGYRVDVPVRYVKKI